jgi:hypothetical protein
MRQAPAPAGTPESRGRGALRAIRSPPFL